MRKGRVEEGEEIEKEKKEEEEEEESGEGVRRGGEYWEGLWGRNKEYGKEEEVVILCLETVVECK